MGFDCENLTPYGGFDKIVEQIMDEKVRVPYDIKSHQARDSVGILYKALINRQEIHEILGRGKPDLNADFRKGIEELSEERREELIKKLRVLYED